MQIGIFGGSFDPVHLGHLWIGEAATQSLSLDRLHWIPTATQPLKPHGPVASNEHRLAMLRLAIAGREGHLVDDREIRRSGVSYTFDTMQELQAEDPKADLHLVIGSDSLASFPRWHRPAELLERVSLAVVQRGGMPDVDWSVLDGIASAESISKAKQSLIQMPVIEIASSDIRERAGQGRGVRYLVPRPVEAYMKANGVYAGS